MSEDDEQGTDWLNAEIAGAKWSELSEQDKQTLINIHWAAADKDPTRMDVTPEEKLLSWSLLTDDQKGQMIEAYLRNIEHTEGQS